MAPTKVCRTVYAWDIWAALISSLVVLAVLFFILVDATLRLVRGDSGDLRSLVAMMVCSLVISQLACIYWMYTRNNIPDELVLLEEYLSKGKIVIGDVHYPADKEAVRCCIDKTKGTVFYRHPMAQYKGCFIRKQVTLVDKYDRELETMLVLPGEPYSAQPRPDIQGMLAIGKKRYESMRILEKCSLIVFLFGLITAVSVVFVKYWLDDDEDKPVWTRYLGWIIYGLTCILMPCVAKLVSGIRWKHHLEWMKRGNHRFVQDDDDYSDLNHLPGGVRDTVPKQDA